MQELKYKAWLHYEKVMVDVVTINLQEKVIGYYDCTGMNGAEAFELIRNGEPNADCPFERCNLRRFTGLSDKNGKEIYEGDIVMVPNQFVSEDVPGVIVSEVVREKGYFDLNHKRLPEFNEDDRSTYYGLIPLFAYNQGEVEIIGNIYEHPHLLEGGASE